MKKLFTLVLAAGMVAACGTKPEATLTAEVVGAADSTKVFLANADGVRLDSTTVMAGKFNFNIAKAFPDQAFVVIDGVAAPMAFFVEPGAINAMIDLSVQPVSATFAGTPTNDGAVALNTELKAFDDRAAAIMPAIQAAQGTPAFDSLAAQYGAIEAERDAYIANFVTANPATVLSAYLASGSMHSLTTPEMADSVITLLAAAPANAFTDKITARREVLALTAVGQPAPDFTLPQVDGTPLALSSLKGKLVLVDFWASWCGPCRAENPNVVALYNAYKEKGLEVLGVSLDNNRDTWTQAIEADGLAWLHVSDLAGFKNAVAVQYGIVSIPSTVLVDANGVIVAKGLRGEALAAKVAEILDAPAAE